MVEYYSLIVAMFLIVFLLCKEFFKITNKSPHPKGMDLVGYTVIIAEVSEDKHCCIGCICGLSYDRLKCYSDCLTKVGDIRIIKTFRNGIYYLY